MIGLLALMLLQESRRRGADVADGRADSAGGSGPLAVEPRADRRRDWRWCERALSSRPVRAVHASGGDRGRACRGADAPAATDWAQIVGLYDVLSRIEPSPVVELNRAVAVAMRDGPAAGLELIDAHPRPRRVGRLPPGPRGPGRSVPAAGTERPRPGRRTSGPCARPAGAGAAVSRRAGWRAIGLNRPPGKIFSNLSVRLSISGSRQTTSCQ